MADKAPGQRLSTYIEETKNRRFNAALPRPLDRGPLSYVHYIPTFVLFPTNLVLGTTVSRDNN